MITTGRLEAFSDAVITIMVLVPNDASILALAALVPVFISYVLSFIYIGIYWNNPYHMLHAAKPVNGRTLGEYVFVILAVHGSFCNCLDGRKITLPSGRRSCMILYC